MLRVARKCHKSSTSAKITLILVSFSSYRWFYHFYLFASTFYATLALSMYQVYYLKQSIPEHVQILLDSWVGPSRRATGKGIPIITVICPNRSPHFRIPVMPESVIIAMVLIIIQVTRRLGECIFLSVYSEAKMNIVHYVFGLLFYFGVGLSLLAEAPGFAGRGNCNVYLMMITLMGSRDFSTTV